VKTLILMNIIIQTKLGYSSHPFASHVSDCPVHAPRHSAILSFK